MSKLDKFTSSYKTVTTNFTSLLQYPFLQDIVLSDSPENSDQDLRTIVTDGSSRFGQLCTTNISIAQQVNSYGRTVPLLLKSLTIAKYASSTKPLIDQYVAESQASAGNNEQFFEDVRFFLRYFSELSNFELNTFVSSSKRISYFWITRLHLWQARLAISQPKSRKLQPSLHRPM